MSERVAAVRVCSQGCTKRGVHYATCASYDGSDSDCGGCAPSPARHGAMVCDRCFGRLRNRIEIIPDLVAMLRSVADPRKATAYDRILVKGSAPEGIPAPVQADIIDAQIDLLHIIGAGQLRPGTESDEAYEHALGAVGAVLRGFSAIANNAGDFAHWWQLVMPVEFPGQREFWTVTRVMQRWPLEDRRRWAKQPCPECEMKTVRIDPPRHRHALTWFSCKSCQWRKNENDDDGLWAGAFGLYAEPDQTKERPTMSKPSMHPELDLTAALKTGTDFISGIESSADLTQGQLAAFLVGATPALAEAFASIADEVAVTARASYEQGSLLAGGARLVASAIRDAADATRAEGTTVAEQLSAKGVVEHG